MTVQCEWDAALGVVVIENPGGAPLRAQTLDPATRRDLDAGDIAAGGATAIAAPRLPRAPDAPPPRFELLLFDGAAPVRPDAKPLAHIRFDARLTPDLDAPPAGDWRLERRLWSADPRAGAVRAWFDEAPLLGAPPGPKLLADLDRLRRDGGPSGAASVTAVDETGARGPTLLVGAGRTPRLDLAFGLMRETVASPLRAGEAFSTTWPAAELDLEPLGRGVSEAEIVAAFCGLWLPAPLESRAQDEEEDEEEPRRRLRHGVALSRPGVMVTRETANGDRRRALRMEWPEALQGDIVGLAARGRLRLAPRSGGFDAPLIWVPAGGPPELALGLYLGDSIRARDGAAAPALAGALAALEPLHAHAGEAGHWAAPALEGAIADRGAETAIPSLIRAFAQARASGAAPERFSDFMIRLRPARAENSGEDLRGEDLRGDDLGAVEQAVIRRLRRRHRADILSTLAARKIRPDLEPADPDAALAAIERALEPAEQRAAERVLADLNRAADWRNALGRAQEQGRRLSTLLPLADLAAVARRAVAQDMALLNPALEAAGRTPLGRPDEPDNGAWRAIGAAAEPGALGRLRAELVTLPQAEPLRPAVERLATRAALLLLREALTKEPRAAPLVNRYYAWAERALALGADIDWTGGETWTPEASRGAIAIAVARLETAVARDHGAAPPPRLDPAGEPGRAAQLYESRLRLAAGRALKTCRAHRESLAGGYEADLLARAEDLLARLERLAPWLALRLGWEQAARRLAELERDAAEGTPRRRRLAALRRRLSHPPRHWPAIAAEIDRLSRQTDRAAPDRRAQA